MQVQVSVMHMEPLLQELLQITKLCRRGLRQAAKKAAEEEVLDLEALEQAEDSGLDLNLVMSAARMHRLRHNAGGPQVVLHMIILCDAEFLPFHGFQMQPRARVQLQIAEADLPSSYREVDVIETAHCRSA